jgi:hypothetical protein
MLKVDTRASSGVVQMALAIKAIYALEKVGYKRL